MYNHMINNKLKPIKAPNWDLIFDSIGYIVPQ